MKTGIDTSANSAPRHAQKERGPVRPDPRIELVREMIWDGRLFIRDGELHTSEGRELAARWLVGQLDKALN